MNWINSQVNNIISNFRRATKRKAKELSQVETKTPAGAEIKTSEEPNGSSHEIAFGDFFRGERRFLLIVDENKREEEISIVLYDVKNPKGQLMKICVPVVEDDDSLE